MLLGERPFSGTVLPSAVHLENSQFAFGHTTGLKMPRSLDAQNSPNHSERCTPGQEQYLDGLHNLRGPVKNAEHLVSNFIKNFKRVTTEHSVGQGQI